MTSRGKATVRQLCRAMKVSPQAYYAAARPAPASTKAGDLPRVSRGVPVSTLENEIRRITSEQPGWGVRKVWARMRRDGIRVGRRRVWAVMGALGLLLPPPREREAAIRWGKVTVPESNRRWATDQTTAWTRQDGVVSIVPVIDCGDRYVLQVGVEKSQESPVMLTPTARALEEVFSDPRQVPPGLELRTDHGPQFTGADCKDLCDAWGVEHTFAPVGRPTGNAVVERVIETLKIELLWLRDFETIDELREAVTRWQAAYNYDRPHQALQWQTPAERRQAGTGALRKVA
jgi:transposase InsO family protein